MGGSVRCSDTSSLTVTAPVCPSPAPRDPPTNSCDAGGLLDITWRWDPVAGATSYRLQVDNNSGFGSPEFNVTTSSTSYSTNNLTPGTWYSRVRVQTSTSACISPSAWSSTSSVTRFCASCAITLPAGYSVAAGSTVSVFPGISQVGGTVDEVTFTTDTTYASVCPFGTGPCLPPTGSYTDGSASFNSDLTGVAIGSTTLTATGEMTDEPGGPYACTDTATVDVTNPNPWFQVKEGDMTANGNISTQIPATCALPACDPVLITNDTGEDPGVPSFIGSINPTAPNISAENWNAGSTYSGPTPDYDFFESKLPSGVPFEPVSSSVAGSFFNGGGTLYRGYYWYKYEGGPPLTITSAVSLPAGRRVVLMVKEDLIISANINLVDGRSFFMAVARGDIRVTDAAGGAPGTGPHLEGIFLASGQFRTNPGSNQVHVRGGVAALSGIDLQRDLPVNSQTPAEIFEFGPDQFFLFPAPMSQRQISWREVAP